MPTVDIPEKVCPHCGGIRWRIEQEKRKYYIRTRYRCVKKLDEKYKKWAQAHPERIREYQIGRKRDFKTPKYREYCRKREAKHCLELTDRYIKYVLRHNPIYRNAIITKEMIETTRDYLKTTRLLKKIRKCQS